MSSDTPRNRNRAAQIVGQAFPDLTEQEVRRLLTKAQEVKRGERDFALVQCSNGRGLTTDGAVKK